MQYLPKNLYRKRGQIPERDHAQNAQACDTQMIATFDTETEGGFGDIRLIGWYDGHDYRVSTDANDWWAFASEDARVWYGGNHLIVTGLSCLSVMFLKNSTSFSV